MRLLLVEDSIPIQDAVATALRKTGYAVDATGDGQVELRFASTDGSFTLSVANTITNLEPADVSRLFDRFWRTDTSRTDATLSGLGLPLARSFAELLGLELSATLEGDTR